MINMDEAANIVRDSGGRLVGRTRFQKLSYILEIAGLGAGFNFEYRRFGPYSDELNLSTRDARLLGLLDEEERGTDWGGTFSIFTTQERARDDVNPSRIRLAQIAIAADPVELELAATALFLHLDGYSDAWTETARRKPQKAKDQRIEKAKALYQKIRRVDTPIALPEVA